MRRILTLGMGRSGTTFVTEFLGKCGVFLDEVNWAFEHEDARAINDTILADLYGARRGLPYGVLPVEEITVGEKWHTKARRFVEGMDKRATAAKASSWTFKDPRSTILHSIWIDQFDTVVAMFRRPEQVVASYITQEWAQGKNPEWTVLSYWMKFNRSLLYLHEKFASKKTFCVLNYNRDIEPQTLKMCGILGVTPNDEARRLFDKNKNRHGNVSAAKDSEAEAIFSALEKIALPV
jgi:hypothetical protein